MKSLNTKMGVVGILLFCCVNLNAQTFTVQSGKWSTPSTWSGGIVPDSTAGTITINHKLTLSSDTTLKVDEIILNDTLIIEIGSTLLLSNALTKLPDLQVLTGGLKVRGRFVCLDSTTTSGTTAENTFFYDGSTYEHRFFSVAGTPPVATWSMDSNLEITGYRSTKTLNNVLWSQSFGNVIYNCPLQQVFIELAGRLKNIKGDLIILNTNGGMLRFSLDATTSTNIVIGGDLIISGRSLVWFSREASTTISVGGDFKYLSTATASSYLTTTGNCQIQVEGNFEMNSSSLLRFASGSEDGMGTLRVRKNFQFTAGTIRVSDGTGIGLLEMNGSALQFFTSLGSWTSGVNLLISNNGGVQIEDNSKVEGNVSVSSLGKLTLPNANFILHGDLTVQNGGTINANDGTVVLSGSLNQSLLLSGNTMHHIHVNKSAGSSISFLNAARQSGILSILSANTTVISNGNLTLLSLSDDGGADASINTLPTGSSILGNVTVQRYMKGEGRIYRYISSPVSNASVDSLMDDFPITGTFNDPSTGPGIRSNSPSFFYYNEKLVNPLGWIAYPSIGSASENILEAGRGYSAFIREPSNATTWDVTGVINQHDIALPITFTDTGNPSNDGWNLVGNPYPSAIDWSADNGWTKVHVNNGIAVRDNGVGGFLYWDGEIGSLGSGRIATGQSFWVKSNDLNPQLTIKETGKTSLASGFHRKRASELDYLEVILNHSTHDERTYLRLHDKASPEYDSLDVVKFANDFINLSFQINKMPLAISAIRELDCSQPHALNLSFAKNSNGSFVQSPLGEYTLSINSFGLFNIQEIILHDDFTHVDVNLKTSSYAFQITTDSASYKSNRFSVLFKAPTLKSLVSVLLDSVLCDNTFTYPIQLKSTQPNTRYQILLNNHEVANCISQNESLSFTLESIALNSGATNLKVKANNLCFAKEIGEFVVWKETTNPPDLSAEKVCNDNQISLHIQRAKGATAFNWYDHNGILLEQTRDSSLVMSIQKPTTFYATSIFNHGCVSDTSSVYADVVWFDKPVITEDRGVLFSNYITDNQWSLNGEKILEANQSAFKPLTSGYYTLTITQKGCMDSTSQYFIYQDEHCQVFPNPVEDEVQIIAPLDELIVEIEISNIAGQSLGVIKSGQSAKALIVSLRHFATGIYSLNIQTSKNRYINRVSKK